jgi:hypothetical protein
LLGPLAVRGHRSIVCTAQLWICQAAILHASY